MKGFYMLVFGFNLLITVSFMGEANNNAAKSKSRRVYIAYMGASRSQVGAPRSDHAQLLGLLMRRKKNPVVHIYNNSFSGFAARLSEKEAKSIASRDGVVSVFPDRVLKLDTSRSWDFLKSQQNANIKFDLTPTSSPSISNKPSSRAYNAIIGILDSGKKNMFVKTGYGCCACSATVAIVVAVNCRGSC